MVEPFDTKSVLDGTRRRQIRRMIAAFIDGFSPIGEFARYLTLARDREGDVLAHSRSEGRQRAEHSDNDK